MQPLVSIIINCHNGDMYALDCINSVNSQTYKNWEIIFWDNASKKKSMINKLSKKNDKVKYYYNKTFTSLGEARNLAIEKAKGEYLAFLDIDDTWEKTKLEEQICAFKDPQVAICYTNSSIFNNKKIIKKKIEEKFLPSGYVFSKMLSSYFMVMSSVMIRKQALNNLNLRFNPKYEIIEEYDLFLRIAKVYRVYSIKKVLTNLRWHDNNTTSTKRDKISREKRLLLKSLERDYKNFNIEYFNEINKVKSKILLSLALNIFLKQNNGKKCRKLLLKSSGLSLKGIVVFLFSYLKPKNAINLYEFIKKNPLI